MTASAAALPDAPPHPPADPPPPAAPAAAVPRTVITPPAAWEWINVRELWAFRELIGFFIWRDVKVRYKQTALGAAWAILQPLMTVAVFTFVFGRVARLSTGSVPEPLFYLSGLIPWLFFSQGLSAAANSVLGAERLVTKIYFPRLAVPFAAVGVIAVDFLVTCGLLAAMVVGYATFLNYDYRLNWNLLAIPLVVLIVALLATGLGTLFAALNVRYRDFRYLVPFALQIGMYATPTIYFQPTGEEGRSVQYLMAANPMTSLVSAFRAGIVGGDIPWAGLGIGAGVAAVTFVVGCLYFRRTEDQFADII